MNLIILTDKEKNIMKPIFAKEMGIDKKDSFLDEMYDNPVVLANARKLYDLRQKSKISIYGAKEFIITLVFVIIWSLPTLFAAALLSACEMILSIDANNPSIYSDSIFLEFLLQLALGFIGFYIFFFIRGKLKIKKVNNEYDNLMLEQVSLLKEIYELRKSQKNPESSKTQQKDTEELKPPVFDDLRDEGFRLKDSEKEIAKKHFASILNASLYDEFFDEIFEDKALESEYVNFLKLRSKQVSLKMLMFLVPLVIFFCSDMFAQGTILYGFFERFKFEILLALEVALYFLYDKRQNKIIIFNIKLKKVLSQKYIYFKKEKNKSKD